MYTAGSVVLEVVTSFAGTQRDIANHVRRGAAAGAKDAQRELDKIEVEADRSGAKAGQKYGSAYERAIRSRIPRMREAIKDLGKGLDENDPLGRYVEKQKRALRAIEKLDLGSIGGQSKAEEGLRRMTRELDDVIRKGEVGGRRLDDMAKVNMGALRSQISDINREMEKWNRAGPRTSDDLVQQAGAKQVRAAREMNRELDRRQLTEQRLGQMQAQAAREMEEAFNRRAEKHMSAIQKEESATRALANLQAQARRAMDADYNRRGDEIMQGRRDEIARKLRDISDRAGQDKELRIGVDVDEIGAITQMRNTRTALEGILAEAIDLGIDVDEFEAVRSARRAVTAAERAVEASVLRFRATVEKDKALAEAVRLRSQIAAIGDDIKWNPHLDTAATSAKIQYLKQQLRSISGSVNVSGDILRLEALDRQLSRVGTQAGKTKAILATMNASGAANSVRVFNGVLLAAVAIGPLLIPVLAVISAGIIGVGVAALTSLVGIGALIAGLAGIGGAVKAMSELQKAKRTAPGGTKKVDSGRQDIADARALADAQKALNKAREASALAAQAAAEKVVQAEADVVKAHQKSAEAIEAAAERQRAAELDLAKAQQSALDAQEALNDARAQAIRDLEDMNDQLASARLAEQANAFTVEEAAVHYNVVLEDDQATDREKAKAKLAYDQAIQSQKEQKTSLERLKVDVKKANDDGIEGSSRVVKAKDAIVSANERIVDAEKTLAAAVKNVSEVQVDQAENIANAQKSLAEAIKDVSKVRIDQAENVAEAEQRIARLYEDQSLRAAEAAMGTNALATATNNLEEAMRNLSPAGQAFAAFIYSLSPLLRDLRFAAQEGMLPGFQEALESIVGTYGPQMVTFMGTLSTAIGDMAVAAANALTGPWWSQFFDYMAELAPTFIEQFGAITGNLLTFVAGISQAFAPLSLEIMDTLVAGSENIALWAQGLKDSPTFQAFIEYLRDSAPIVGELFQNLFTIVGKLLVGLAPYADTLLGIAVAFTEWLASMDPKTLAEVALAIGGIVLGVQALAGIMAPLLGFLGLINTLMGLGTVLTTVGSALSAMGGALVAFLAGISAPVWAIIAAVVALIAVFVLLWNKNEGFRDGVKAIWASIVGAWNATFGWIKDTAIPNLIDAWDTLWEVHLRPILDAIVMGWDALWEAFLLGWDILDKMFFQPFAAVVTWLWDNVIKPYFGFIWDIIMNFLVPVFVYLWESVISPIFGFIGGVFEVVWGIAERVFNAIYQIIKFVLAPVFQWLYDTIIKPTWDAIGAAIDWVWTQTIKPVFEALSSFINDTIAPKFQSAVDLLGAIWGGLLDFMRTPIRLAIEYVINKGLIGAFNWIAEKVPGMTKLDLVTIPDALQPGGNAPASVGGQQNSSMGKGFAAGGVLPGYSVGVDNHRFFSDTGIQLDLAGGEGILIPEVTRLLGPKRLREANRLGRQGNLPEAMDALSFAQGGVFPGGSQTGGGLDDFFGWFGDRWGDVTRIVGGVAEFIADPVKSLTNVVKNSAEGLGLSGFLGEAGIGMALAPIQGIADWVNSLFDDDTEEKSGAGTFAGIGASLGYKLMETLVAGAVPGARVTSDFRPGAMTAVGTKSYHGMGRAVDFAPNWDVFNWIAQNYPDSRELIYTPAGMRQIWNGRNYQDFAPVTKAMHNNHIHWAMAGGGLVPTLYDQGGDLPPGLSMVANKTGRPERVVTEKMMTEIRQATAQRMGDGGDVNINGDLVGYTPKEIAREIQAERRRVMAVRGVKQIGVMVS